MRTSKQQVYLLVLTTTVLLLMAPALLAADDTIARGPFIFDTSTDRTPAVTAFPEYPRIARRDRIQGDATVCFTIDTNGRIRRPRIKEVSHPIFKRAALRAIRASSFAPLAPNQLLTTAPTCRTYRFRLTALKT
ncbi:MAG: energy transducer TonB [Woeseia sp.]|jgi:TonB family protein